MEQKPEGKNKCGERIKTKDSSNAAVYVPAVVKSHRMKGHTFPFLNHTWAYDLADFLCANLSLIHQT